MNYEVWHTDNDRKMGKIELVNPIDHTPGVKVVIKLRRHIESQDGKKKWNAVELCVCRMKDTSGTEYYALETNLPLPLIKNLEGFTPHIQQPSLMEIFHLGKPIGKEIK